MQRQNDGRLGMESAPNPIDIYIGERIRVRRNLCGLPIEALADGLGVTFQQVENYENGTNRVGASRLFELSRLLKVAIRYFYDGVPDDRSLSPHARPLGALEQSAPIHVLEGEKSREKETQELVQAYFHIADQGIRRRALDLLKSMSSLETMRGTGASYETH